MTHHYPVHVTWTGGRAGHGAVALEKRTHDVPIGVPSELAERRPESAVPRPT